MAAKVLMRRDAEFADAFNTLFRQAPRLPRHTLPQGFYVQVFIGVQFLMFMLLMVLLFQFIPSLSGNGSEASGFMVLGVLPERGDGVGLEVGGEGARGSERDGDNG